VGVSDPLPEPQTPTRAGVVSVHILAGLGALGAIATLSGFWFPLILSAWAAGLARPLYRRLSQAMRGRGRSASVVTVLLVVLVLSPVTVVLLTLTGDAVDLIARIQQSPSVSAALSALSSDPGADANTVTSAADSVSKLATDPAQLLEFVRTHGEGALGIAGRVLGVTFSVLIGLVVFVVGFYNNLTHGREIGEWLIKNSPLPEYASRRMIAAFHETGRGLLAAIGLTALAQGTVAGIGYLAVGVPHGLVLGLLTAIAALVPSIGTGLVWAPVAIGLLMSGRSGAGIAIIVLGLVVSSVDNVLRPLLSRVGNLQLPAFVLFVSLLGGLVVFGSMGVILGPLLVRLAVEATSLSRELRHGRVDAGGVAVEEVRREKEERATMP
jgi:predicted PurR-regulated permease PerM